MAPLAIRCLEIAKKMSSYIDIFPAVQMRKMALFSWATATKISKKLSWGKRHENILFSWGFPHERPRKTPRVNRGFRGENPTKTKSFRGENPTKTPKISTKTFLKTGVFVRKTPRKQNVFVGILHESLGDHTVFDSDVPHLSFTLTHT